MWMQIIQQIVLDAKYILLWMLSISQPHTALLSFMRAGESFLLERLILAHSLHSSLGHSQTAHCNGLRLL